MALTPTAKWNVAGIGGSYNLLLARDGRRLHGIHVFGEMVNRDGPVYPSVQIWFGDQGVGVSASAPLQAQLFLKRRWR